MAEKALPHSQHKPRKARGERFWLTPATPPTLATSVEPIAGSNSPAIQSP
jgi:hypothetical protein